jgi:hypothetical protein
MTGFLLLLAVQSATWMSYPAAPTVGDTVTLERLVPTDPGALGRTRMLDPSDQLEPLGPPEIRPAAGGLLVRHVVALFAPGRHTISMPAIEVLHADGTVEVILGDTAQVVIAAVIPDTLADPQPRPSQAPLARPARRPVAVAIPVLMVAAVLGLWLARRRRPPRATAAVPAAPAPPELPLMRWLGAGERRAVATIAAHRLRAAVAEVVPAAAVTSDVETWATAVTEARPSWPVDELADVMRALERARFAPLAGDDLVELVDRTDVVLGRLGAPEEPDA